MGNKRVPEVRFAGYRGDWEERKLIDVAKYRNGKAHEKYISDNGKYIVVNSKFVSTNGHVKKYSDKQIEPMYVDEISFVLSDVPNGRAIARTFLIDENDKYSLNQRIAGLTTNSNTNAYFLYTLMNRHHYFLRFDDGVGQTNLSKNDVEKFREKYPSIEEQTKVGRFFQQLDKTIALHQQELDTLKQTKQGFLQKMFPKEGESVPAIRFPGFTRDWERHKLGDLARIVRGASPRPIQDPKWFDESSDIGWLRISDVTEQDGRIHSLEQKISESGQEKTRVIIEPHLLLSIAATVGKPVINYVKTGVHDGFLIFTNPNFHQEFMFQWLEMFRPKWKKYGQPGSQVNLNSELVRIQDIKMPSFQEQTQIGNFFKQLDDTIALHEQELDTLKQTKKAFLQKMFV